MPGFYDYLLNEIHVEDAPPLFLKYFPTEGVLVMLGPSSSCWPQGLAPSGRSLHLMEDLHQAVPNSAPLPVQ